MYKTRRARGRFRERLRRHGNQRRGNPGRTDGGITFPWNGTPRKREIRANGDRGGPRRTNGKRILLLEARRVPAGNPAGETDDRRETWRNMTGDGRLEEERNQNGGKPHAGRTNKKWGSRNRMLDGNPQHVKRRRATLPHPLECSTIAAPGLSYRVRNGTGRLTRAMTTANLTATARKPKESKPACHRWRSGNRLADARQTPIV